jgi:nucleoside-diphosphate-sugar epimerase
LSQEDKNTMSGQRQRILITGGSGQLGAAICNTLKRRFKPISFDLRPTQRGVEFIQGSVLSAAELREAAKGVDSLIHVAALLPRGQPPDAVFQTNVIGTWNAFSAAEAAGCRNFLFVSSECATGLCFQKADRMPAYLPIDEDHPLEPVEAYGMSKQIGEVIAEAFRRRSTMRTVVLRPLYILFDHEAQQIPDRQDLWHRDLWGYVDPEDVASAAESVLLNSKASSVYFIGAPDTLCDVPTLSLVQERFGALPPIRDPGFYQRNPCGALFDSGRARRELGLQLRSTWRAKLARITMMARE